MCRVLAAVLLSCAVLPACVPSVYRISFPSSATEAIPIDFFGSKEEVLVIPCWRWVRTSEYGFGPPAIVSVSDLEVFPSRLRRWTGFEMIDIFDHEGGAAPVPWSVLLIGSEGQALRLNQELESAKDPSGEARWFWTVESTQVGPGIKDGLLAGAASIGADVSREVAQRLFGVPYGRFLGEPSDYEALSEFVAKLEGSGRDAWTLLEDPTGG